MATLADFTFPQPPAIDNPFNDITLWSAINAAMTNCPGYSYLQPPPSPLDKEEWVQALDKGSYEKVLDRKALLARGGLFPENHLFKSLARRGMIRDSQVYFTQHPSATVLNIYALAHDVCGHDGIVHGGLSSAIIDESFGYLMYLCRQSGDLNFGMVMTAHLEVDYKKPIQSGAIVVCIATVERVEGRKIWVRAELMDRPGGALYATGKALFIVPRGKESKVGNALF